MNLYFIKMLFLLITIILIYLLFKFSRNEYFDDRFIYEEVKLEPIEYAGLVGEQADWKIYKIKPTAGTGAKVRHSISFKASDLNEAGFEDVSDDQGVNNPLLIPYMLDIMRKQSIEIKNIQESQGKMQSQLYELEK